MFLSGSCYFKDVKGGVVVIVKMVKVRIMLVVYRGFMVFKNLLKGYCVDMNFGNFIDVFDIKCMDVEGIVEVFCCIQEEFDCLDRENEIYDDGKKLNLLIYIYCLFLVIIVIVLFVLILIFSYLVSFVWDL